MGYDAVLWYVCLMDCDAASYGMLGCVFRRASQDVSNERTAFVPKVLCTKRNLEYKTTTLLGVHVCESFGYADSRYMQGTVSMEGNEITSYVT